jgi:hypothetical protein
MISRVWNLDQGSRSIRAGIKLLIDGLLAVVEDVVAMFAPYSSRHQSPLLCGDLVSGPSLP